MLAGFLLGIVHDRRLMREAQVNWDHLRTRGALSQETAKLMVFTLVRAASKRWRKLNGTNRLPSVIEGVKFTDAVAQRDATESRAA